MTLNFLKGAFRFFFLGLDLGLGLGFRDFFLLERRLFFERRLDFFFDVRRFFLLRLFLLFERLFLLRLDFFFEERRLRFDFFTDGFLPLRTFATLTLLYFPVLVRYTRSPCLSSRTALGFPSHNCPHIYSDKHFFTTLPQ
jgi:hypothetical protein